MFGLFRQKPRYPQKPRDPGLPPTEKQLRFAKRIGVAVPPGATRHQVSAAIDDAMARDPSIRQRLNKINEKREARAAAKREAMLGPDIIRRERHWEEVCDSRALILAVYEQKGTLIVDVVAPEEAIVDEAKRSLRFTFIVAKRCTESELRDFVDWDCDRRPVSIRPEQLLYAEMVSNDAMMSQHDYGLIVSRGLKIAAEIRDGKRPPMRH